MKKTNTYHPQLLFILFFNLVFLSLVLLHIDGVNGPYFWRRPWRDLSFYDTAFKMLLPMLILGYILWSLEKRKKKINIPAVLTALVISAFLFQLAGIFSEPNYHALIQATVASPSATGYFTDASEITDAATFLASFHTLNLRLHPSTHPPGPILYYYVFILLFGAQAGALFGGLMVGILSSLGVVVLYLFSGLWTTDKYTRLMICALYPLIPGLTLFFPQFDQIYPIFSMLMIYTWEKTLRKDTRFLLLFAFILFGATLFAYNLLTIGAFLLLSSLYYYAQDRDKIKKIIVVAFSSLAVWGSLHLVFSLVTGYRPILSFSRALINQGNILELLSRHNMTRPYNYNILYDVYDFFVGSGIIIFPLLVLFIKDSIKLLEINRYDIVLSYIGLATILIIDITGLLAGETARVWLFLQPLVLVPAGLKLTQISTMNRCAVFFVMWITVVTLKSNMYF